MLRRIKPYYCYSNPCGFTLQCDQSGLDWSLGECPRIRWRKGSCGHCQLNQDNTADNSLTLEIQRNNSAYRELQLLLFRNHGAHKWASLLSLGTPAMEAWMEYWVEKWCNGSLVVGILFWWYEGEEIELRNALSEAHLAILIRNQNRSAKGQGVPMSKDLLELA